MFMIVSNVDILHEVAGNFGWRPLVPTDDAKEPLTILSSERAYPSASDFLRGTDY